MATEIVINVAREESRVALIENKVVTELYFDRKKERGIVGNVYKGKIVKVLPGMQAAFVDIGMEKAAFLYVADIMIKKPVEVKPVKQVALAQEKKPAVTRELPEDYEISLLLEDKRVLLEQDGIVLGVDDEEDANNNTDDANAALRNYAPHVLIFSSGDMTPFELHIERLTDKLSVAMQGDLLGNLEFVTDEEQRF